MATLTFKRYIRFNEATPSKKFTADSTSYPQAGKIGQVFAVVTKQYEESAIFNKELSGVCNGTNTKVGEKKLRTPVSASVVTT